MSTSDMNQLRSRANCIAGMMNWTIREVCRNHIIFDTGEGWLAQYRADGQAFDRLYQKGRAQNVALVERMLILTVLLPSLVTMMLKWFL